MFSGAKFKKWARVKQHHHHQHQQQPENLLSPQSNVNKKQQRLHIHLPILWSIESQKRVRRELKSEWKTHKILYGMPTCKPMLKPQRKQIKQNSKQPS